MICRILRICHILDQYRVPIEAYINGARGDSLKHICFKAFMGSVEYDLPFVPGGSNEKIWDLIDQANWHVRDVEDFFFDYCGVSFAGMLP